MNADGDEEERERAARAAMRKRREDYLENLFGSADPLTLHAPAAVEDFDALLGEHAAQLRNAARYTMGYVISDNVSLPSQAKMLGSLTRVIQTNIAIANILTARAKSKTVRGVATNEDTQD